MKQITAILGAAAMALASSISGAAAQNQMGASDIVANPKTVVPNFSVQTVGPVLNELGMPWQVRQLDSGAQFIHAASGSMQFFIFFTVCKQAGCSGMYAQTIFEGDANPQTVQAFNARQPFGSVGVTQDGAAYAVRYDIADYGIPRGNIAVSLANFLNMSQMFASELAAAHQTVSLEGYADDLASSSLNRKALQHFTGLEMQTPGDGVLHQQGLEEGAEMIRMLLSDESVPRNKIENKLD
ncbi:MAG: hypothetical protein CMI63_03205 [Parvularcula sp.]|nr:hypothetical protein [Parvularcula sp.]